MCTFKHAYSYTREHTQTLQHTNHLTPHFCAVFLSLTTSAPVPSPPDRQTFTSTKDVLSLLIHTSATGFTDISTLVWFQHVSLCSLESRNKGKSIVPKSGCVFKVRNGPTGESKNIYIGCPTKNAVTLTRTSILESASYYLKNCKSIGKTKNEERIISTV